MIAAITGTIINKNNSKILLQNSSGICFEIFVSESVYNSTPDIGELTLYTSFIVREQEMYLVGFHSLDEKQLFEILITAKGIGPKQAMKILGDIPAAELRLSIISRDISRLTKIKGISSKKAEQLMLDLQEKIKKTMDELSPNLHNIDPSSKIKTEVLLTMRALGYSDIEIKKPLDLFFSSLDISAITSTENIVSEFLLTLSRR